MAFKKLRNMKIYGMSGYKYKATPTIMLKGQWLKELGFEIGGYVSISCENGKLVITPDAETAAMKEAEAAFMERETLLLQKRFKEEKEKLHAQFVAERKADYGICAEQGV
jgi:antitoxin component of MazEF toxin-antitoxin module